MIKLLLVEDEQSIRRGIRNSIDWHNNDIDICGEASNGQEALTSIECLEPDIILLDIRMPIMNGLEVLKTLHRQKASLKTIVLSGYDDFSYVQKAMKYGASDYLLKPCSPKEILDTVLRLKSVILDEQQKRNYLDNFKPMMHKSAILLKEKFLHQLTLNKIYDYANLAQDFNTYQINLLPKQVIVTLIQSDEYIENNISPFTDAIDLMRFAISNITYELLSPEFHIEIIEINEHIVVLCSLIQSQLEIYKATLKRIQSEVKDLLGVTISIGMGTIYEHISSAHDSYEEACKAMDHKFWKGNNVIVDYADIKHLYTEEVTYPLTQENSILTMIRMHIPNKDDITKEINTFFSVFSPHSTPIEFVHQSGLILALSIYRLYLSQKLDNKASGDAIFSYIESIRKSETLDRLKSNLYELILYTEKDLNQVESKNKLVNKAIDYIVKHYAQDIGLETVASYVDITPSYLSTLFKKHCGVNFLEYLHRVRIGEACELIKNDIWIRGYELAAAVGYKEESYFYKVFKKITGLTPTQFKENL